MLFPQWHFPREVLGQKDVDFSSERGPGTVLSCVVRLQPGVHAADVLLLLLIKRISLLNLLCVGNNYLDCMSLVWFSASFLS